MQLKKVSMVFVMVLLACAVAPMMAEDSYASTQGGVTVSPVIGGDNISLKANSGSSASIDLYVTNRTDSYMGVEVGDVTGLKDQATISSTIMVRGTESTLIYPKGNDGYDVAVITLTFTADIYANTDTLSGVITILVNDVENTESKLLTFNLNYRLQVTSVFSTGDSYNKFFGKIPNTLDEPFNKTSFTAGITLVLWVIITYLVVKFIAPLFMRLVKDRKTKDEKEAMVRKLTNMVCALMFVVAINECLQIIGANAEILHIVGAVSAVIYIILAGTIAWQLYVFIITIFLKGIYDVTDLDGVDMSLLPLFKMIGKLVITIGCLCAALAAFGVDLAGILVSAGVVTLGITLGAQNTLNQFFSGIVLLASRPFKKGDFIEINGNSYKVRRVRLMYTELASWNMDQIVTIPNNVVSSATLVNLTKEFHRTRAYIFVTVPYGIDLDAVKKCLLDAARKHPHVLREKGFAPGTRLTQFAESGVEYRLSVYLDDYDNNASYAGEIREFVYNEFNEKGIPFVYNRLEVDILNNDPNSSQEEVFKPLRHEEPEVPAYSKDQPSDDGSADPTQ